MGVCFFELTGMNQSQIPIGLQFKSEACDLYHICL